MLTLNSDLAYLFMFQAGSVILCYSVSNVYANIALKVFPSVASTKVSMKSQKKTNMQDSLCAQNLAGS